MGRIVRNEQSFPIGNLPISTKINISMNNRLLFSEGGCGGRGGEFLTLFRLVNNFVTIILILV
jgi:hypothetical protein